MTRHIHFCNIGLKPDPPLAICITSFPKDMVYLVNSPKSDGDAYTENELHIREHLSNVGIHNVETIHIHPYDFDSIIETIERTITKELSQDRECMFHFNITAGTNISAGAMCVVAMSTKNADIYHLREGKYCKPPTKQGELSYIELADMNSVRLLESRPRDAEFARSDIGERIDSP